MHVVVVGGGIVGVASADYLAERGADVTVCERATLGSGSTERAVGGIRGRSPAPRTPPPTGSRTPTSLSRGSPGRAARRVSTCPSPRAGGRWPSSTPNGRSPRTTRWSSTSTPVRTSGPSARAGRWSVATSPSATRRPIPTATTRTPTWSGPRPPSSARASTADYFGPETRIRRGWAGLYAVTPDHHPVIEETMPGLVTASGFSGHGFQHAPATGQVVAQLVLDGEASLVDVSGLDSDRFERGEALVERNVA